MTLLKEGLKAGDLEGVVSQRFSIDQYKSKMGEDSNIMVLAFTVDGQAPAKDLERFAEVGYKSVLDADATPGSMEDGKHRVFIEFARTPEVVGQIIAFLEDLKKLTNIDEFTYTYHKGDNPTVVSADTMGEAIPTTPEAYEQRINEMKVSEARHFFDKYDMMECKIAIVQCKILTTRTCKKATLTCKIISQCKMSISMCRIIGCRILTGVVIRLLLTGIVIRISTGIVIRI